MAVPLSWSTPLSDEVTLSPDESQLSPCKNQSVNTGGPPAHLSLLEVSSYATSKSPLPLSWASPLPRRAENRYAAGGLGLQPADPSKRKRTVVAAPEQHFPPPQSPPGYVSIAHTDGECLSLTAPGKRPPHLSFKLGAWRALQVLCSTVPEGLEAWELHKIMFSCSWSQTRSDLQMPAALICHPSVWGTGLRLACAIGDVWTKLICACLSARGSAMLSTETTGLRSLSMGILPSLLHIQNTCPRSEIPLQWLSLWVTYQ